MKHQSGFTLVELMIVVAIIAVIAAIAIPSILGARISANQQSAQATLRAYHGAQETTKQNSQLENQQAYWDCDIWGLYGYQPQADGDPLEAIQRSVAQADNDIVGAGGDIASANMADTPTARTSDAGYFYAAFEDDDSIALASDGDCLNPTSFAAQALPEHYDTTGRRVYAVGVRGDIYSIDGLNAPTVDYSSAEILPESGSGTHKIDDFNLVDPDADTDPWTAE